MIADLAYATVSGCMTAQTSHEVDFQSSRMATAKHAQVGGSGGKSVEAVTFSGGGMV